MRMQNNFFNFFWKALEKDSFQSKVSGREFISKPWDSPAFPMIEPIYYVGNRYVSSHLLTSEKDHILIDTCNPGSGPLILKGIIDLGFNPGDVKFILLTHGHADHTGSAGFLANETGAKICLGEEDVKFCEELGARPPRVTINPKYKEFFEATPFKVDISLKDGDSIPFGDEVIHIYHTPGHTPGSCTFRFQIENENKKHDVFLVSSSGKIGNIELLKPENKILVDSVRTLDLLENFQADVWLGPHPFTNGTFEKLELLKNGYKPNPYIDSKGWKFFLKGLRYYYSKYS